MKTTLCDSRLALITSEGRARSLGRFGTSRSAATIIVLLAGVLWYFSGRPLYHTDLWGHLGYGRWIAGHGRLPPTDPFMAWAPDAAFVDTAWLWQLATYAVYRLGDVTGLQLLQGTLVA